MDWEPDLLRADVVDRKYAEAIVTAATACAEDTAGQTCFICMDGAEEEGLVRGCACRGGNGFAHVSCLARQAQVEVKQAEDSDVDDDEFHQKWDRWSACRLCEQEYHGVVKCALGWACWKTYARRPEDNDLRLGAINQLGNGLSEVEHHEDALTVGEAELAMEQRRGAPESTILTVKSNIASTYQMLGRPEEALKLKQSVYSGLRMLHGDQHKDTLKAASNCVSALVDLQRFEEARELLHTTTTTRQSFNILCHRNLWVASRILGEEHRLTLKMRWIYAEALQGRGLYARRSPRGREYARGHRSNCATRIRSLTSTRGGY
jgi:hypothetical protein